MKAVIAKDRQKRHYPKYYLVNGVMVENPERPERVNLLIAGAMAAGCEIEEPVNYGAEPIAAIHTPRYLKFLSGAYERWARIKGASPAVTPNAHPTRRGDNYPASVVAQAGWHMFDASCPISADTWESAQWSAWTAVHAAKLAMNKARAAYALCRPPGHHAAQDTAGGFCYLNNTAIAAQTLRKKHDRVAILDVDLHHGNGTQEIFYNRNDILTVSIHADPIRFYPFFWGYAAEIGEGDGAGFNLNLPLPRGAGDAEFLVALSSAFEKIADFAPTALVVALGLDAYAGDPIGGLGVTTKGFAKIGRAVGAAAPPATVLVQEGGYPCPELSDNLAAFLGGFQDAG